jgi:nucleoside-diphosphate-sugar epimerase
MDAPSGAISAGPYSDQFMTVFLTGASGYVGKHIAEELLARGHGVIGLARRPSERTLYSSRIEWCFADLATPDDYRASMERSDCIIHSAMEYSQAGAENSNLDAAFLALLDGSRQYVIYTSNLFNPQTAPSRFVRESEAPGEANWRFRNECLVLQSIAASAVIRLGFVYGGTGGYLWEILSAGAVFGIDPQKLPDAMWPMVHVRDVASLYAMIVESWGTGVFHAWDGHPTKARDIVESVGAVYRQRGVSNATTTTDAAALFGKSVQTTNARSRLTGWRPKRQSFVDHVHEAYDEHHGG